MEQTFDGYPHFAECEVWENQTEMVAIQFCLLVFWQKTKFRVEKKILAPYHLAIKL